MFCYVWEEIKTISSRDKAYEWWRLKNKYTGKEVARIKVKRCMNTAIKWRLRHRIWKAYESFSNDDAFSIMAVFSNKREGI